MACSNNELLLNRSSDVDVESHNVHNTIMVSAPLVQSKLNNENTVHIFFNLDLQQINKLLTPLA